MKQFIVFFLILFVCLPVKAAQTDSLYIDDSQRFDNYYLEALTKSLDGKREEAFSLYQKALEIDPTSSAALFGISKYYLAKQQTDRAFEAMKKAVDNAPDVSEYKLLLASIYRQENRFGEAIAIYEELVEKDPGNTELNYYLSELYIRLGAFDKAIVSLDNIENTIGTRESISFQKLKLMLATEKYEDAIAQLKKMTERFPGNASYYVMLGDVYREMKKDDEALKYYEKAKAIDPYDPLYAMSMLDYYQSKQDTEAMNALFEELDSNDALEPELAHIYARYLINQGKEEKAKLQYEKIVNMDPEDYEAWRSLLAFSLNTDDAERIITLCDQALTYFPEGSEFYFYKGIALYQEDRLEEALNTFEEGVKTISPAKRALISTFYGQIGDLNQALQRPEEAYAAYEKALEYNDSNVGVLNNYAYYLSLAKKDLEKAERMSAKSLTLDPNNATYLDTYAWIFFQQENYRLAKFYIEKAVANGGSAKSEVIEHYGDILFKSGEKAKALTEWEKALELRTPGEEAALLEKKIKKQAYYEK